MYTQLYTQLLSFENQRITKYLDQLKDDAAIILGRIISARDVLTIGRMPASFTLLQCGCSLATAPCPDAFAECLQLASMEMVPTSQTPSGRYEPARTFPPRS